MNITKKPRRIRSINPATEEELASFRGNSPQEVDDKIAAAFEAFSLWRLLDIGERAALFRSLAGLLRDREEHYARLITLEMGKPIVQAEQEIRKSADQCEFFAEHAPRYLQDEPVEMDGRRSIVAFEPIGPILAIMPWNFPFSQVTRFAVPALMAGNTALLKHASNVPQCALAIEEAFTAAGFPKGVCSTLLVTSLAVESVIADPRVRGVTITGSSEAGASVARAAGAALKKSVLELGGSDPFIVLRDADVDSAARAAAKTRLSNAGQACACGKRFIVEHQVAEAFEERFATALASARVGDPMDRSTEVGPLARVDLVDELDRQVQESVGMGARVVVGGRRRPGRGFFYEPTLLADCTEDMPVLKEETFGPVAALVRVGDAEEALTLANSSPYGLGATLWTGNLRLADSMARRLDAGSVFINTTLVSDPRLPFGGVKRSGYGRELGAFGVREFVNVQSIVVNTPV